MSPLSKLKQLIAECIVPQPFPPELVFISLYIARDVLPYKRLSHKEFSKSLRICAIRYILHKGWKVDKSTVEEFLKVLAEQCKGLCRDVKCLSSFVIGEILDAIFGSDDDAIGEALAAS